MICKACGGEIPEGRRGRFCSERCRRGVDVAGAGSAESGAPRSPAPDFNRQVKELPPLSPAEKRKALAGGWRSTFTAKYPGTCERCGGVIRRGQEVRFRGFGSNLLEHVGRCEPSDPHRPERQGRRTPGGTQDLAEYLRDQAKLAAGEDASA